MKKLSLLLLSLYSVVGFSQSYFQEKQVATSIMNWNGTTTPITTTIPYQGYAESQSYFGQGEYEIFLDTTDGILDQPIIVLDGFDPGDSRDIAGLYGSLNFDGQNLADILRAEGYDIVVLNAPQYNTGGKDIDGGADYIQRNAFVLVELINFINAEKEGNEELVVLGPSMGGLIARYALAYMEQNSLDHETRLYISFDSPHKGANIPISLQYLINYLGQTLNDPTAIAIVDSVLNSPAAKEMLIDHLLAHLLAGSTFEQDPAALLPAGAPDFRDAFQAEIDALGFPQNVRNVAMVNGSGTGTTIGTPGMQVIDTTLDLGNFVQADVLLHFTPAANQTINVTDFETYVGPITLSTFAANAQSGAIAGVDAAPGGTSNISNALGDGTGNPLIDDFIMDLDQDQFSFIPVNSSLALENEDDWYVIPAIGSAHTSPFVNSYIPNVNERHVSVTAASANFALDEIRQNVLGLEDVNIENRYQLVQNPVGDEIRLRLNPNLSYGSIEIEAYNLAGQRLFVDSILAPDAEISVGHHLATGMYLLHIKDAAGVFNLKFLVGEN